MATNVVLSLPGVTSSNAYLTVVLPPANQTVVVGSNVTLSAQATGGPGNALAYQWRFFGTNLPGATSTNLALGPVQLNQAGTYTFVVTNRLGQATGFDAVLTVLATKPLAIGPCALLTNCSFHLQFEGAAGSTYTVLVSTNLVNWTEAGPATEAAADVFEFTDAEASQHSSRFYRLRSP